MACSFELKVASTEVKLFILPFFVEFHLSWVVLLSFFAFLVSVIIVCILAIGRWNSELGPTFLVDSFNRVRVLCEGLQSEHQTFTRR
jgi:hypothetical protein